MIEFANELTAPLVRQMWKSCFGDTDVFLDILFKYKYKDQNTLIYFEGDKAVASLQMLPYTITFYGEEIPFAYLAGLCTLPEHRSKGYMTELIYEAHDVLKRRDIPLSILIPAEDSLFAYYERFGYEQVFDKGSEPIYPLKKILDASPKIDDAYQRYSAIYKSKDFCVQKSLNDFKAIVEEQTIDGFPEKWNLPGMARIINETHLLNLYASQNHLIELRIKIKDSPLGSATIFSIAHGLAEPTGGTSYDIEVDIRFLSRLLFGYKTDELAEPYESTFPVHHPIMNQMLE